MEENLREEPNSDRNMRLWFRAIRYLPETSIDIAIDRVANWRAMGDSPDSFFYLYIMHVLKAIDGSLIEAQRSRDLIEQSRSRSQHLRNSTRSHEWLGTESGLNRLVNSSELGGWNDDIEFYSETKRLLRVDGRVAHIRSPRSGTLELGSTNLPVFFVPGRSEIVKGRDENQRVTFFLGFSYEGLRAWSIERLK